MTNINSVVVTGNLTRDAELRGKKNGARVLSGCIAVNDSIKVNDEWQDYANYFDFAIFGKRAEALEDYMKKGQRVALHGHLRWQKWEQDGENRTKVSIVVNEVELLGGKSKGKHSDDYEDVELPF